MQEIITHLDGCTILHAAEPYAQPPAYLFDAQQWPQLDALADEGRGNTFFVSDDAGQFVLRHFYRGGQMARVSKDRYLWLGQARCRSFAEWRMLSHLYQLGLPVPQPVAARYAKHGLFYSADLLTRRINAVTTLAAGLSEGRLALSAWRALGKVLRRFHDHGACHADLNAHNILFDGGEVFYLLDFDRGRIRTQGGWMSDNLSRLQRSLLKLKSQREQFAFNESDWLALVESYQNNQSRA